MIRGIKLLLVAAFLLFMKHIEDHSSKQRRYIETCLSLNLISVKSVNSSNKKIEKHGYGIKGFIIRVVTL